MSKNGSLMADVESVNADLIEMLERDLERAIELRDELEDDAANGGNMEAEIGIDVDTLNERIVKLQDQIEELS